MSVPEKFNRLSVEEYLEMEEEAAVRHEYVDGHVFSMTGSNSGHNIISLNIATAFRSKLKNSGCTVYINDFKVRVDEANSFYYPDVLVACGRIDKTSVFTRTPHVIVEVLSRSTAAIDRREKLLSYKKIPTLREYLIVHQSRARVERHIYEDNEWKVHECVSAEDELTITISPDKTVRLTMAEIYESIDLDPSQSLTVQEDSDVIYSW